MARKPITEGALANATPVTNEHAFMVPRLALPPMTTQGRKLRRPKHEFQIRARPWEIQPFMIAPVLPGETLVNATLQARIVTDPIKNPLVGWHQEMWLFYVSHRTMDAFGGDTLITDMHVQGSSLGAYMSSSASIALYRQSSVWSRPAFLSKAMQVIVKWFFRDADEPAAGHTHAGTNTGYSTTSGIHLARVRDSMWMDSLKIEDQNPTVESDLPGQVTQLPPHMTAFQNHYDQWSYMRENKLSDATFEDYLAAFGIKAPQGAKEEEFKPELLRYIKDWSYPSNTVDPTTGVPTSAVSWAIAERADKKRFFKEPGFIIGVSVTRPKVYFAKQKDAAIQMLDDAFAWLPAQMRQDAYTSLVEYDHNEGPIEGIVNAADDYWVDRADLFVHGDQFLNFDHSADLTASTVALPSSTGDNVLNRFYPTTTDMNGVFVDDDASEGKNKVRMDGVVQLNISSHVTDQT